MTSLAFSIGLTGDQVADALHHTDTLELVDNAGAAFVAVGVDRLQSPHAAAARTLESSVAASALALRAPRTGVLAAAAVQHDHPFNLARRIASIDHLTHGRAGVLLGLADAYAPHDAEPSAWGSAGLGTGVPLTAETGRDAAAVIGKLWQSWPSGSIVADRRARIFSRADEIVHIDHDGVYSVAGPLNVPSTPQGSPVLACYVTTDDELAAFTGSVDLVVRGEGVRVARPSDPPAFAELRLAADRADADAIAARIAEAGPVAGIHLVPAPGVARVAELLAITVPQLITRGVLHTTTAQGTLRGRLGLADPERLLDGARPAFAAPVAETL